MEQEKTCVLSHSGALQFHVLHISSISAGIINQLLQNTWRFKTLLGTSECFFLELSSNVVWYSISTKFFKQGTLTSFLTAWREREDKQREPVTTSKRQRPPENALHCLKRVNDSLRFAEESSAPNVMLIKQTWSAACRNKRRRKASRQEVWGWQPSVSPWGLKRGLLDELYREWDLSWTLPASAPKALPVGDRTSHTIFLAWVAPSPDRTHISSLRPPCLLGCHRHSQDGTYIIILYLRVQLPYP